MRIGGEYDRIATRMETDFGFFGVEVSVNQPDTSVNKTYKNRRPVAALPR
jgi:hypothetical protein